MKKYFLVIVLLVLSILNVNAQSRKIVLDEQKDSVRTIEAFGTCVRKFTDTKILNISLQTWVAPNDTSFCVITNVNCLKPLGAFDNARMLIKLMNNEVIELYSVTSDYNLVKRQYAKPTVTTSIWRNRITSTYNSNSVNITRNINYWHITPDVINKLKIGVKKVKIEFRNGVYEKEFNKDKFGNILYECYLSELNYINNNYRENNKFKENF